MTIAQHKGAADPDGIIVRPYGFDWLERDIRRINDDLRIGFDRSRDLYVIYRCDHENVRLKTDTEFNSESWLSYRRPFWTVVLELKWKVAEKRGDMRGWRLKDVPRAPGSWVLPILAGMHRTQLTHDSSAWAEKAIRKNGEDREKAVEDEITARTDAIVEDWSSRVDPADPLRFKPTVSVPEKSW